VQVSGAPGAPGAGPGKGGERGRSEWEEAVQEYIALRQQAGGRVEAVQASLRCAVHACARAARWQAARDLILDAEEAEVGGGGTVGMYTDAIAACARAKQPKEALALLRRMEERGVQGDVAAYSAAINACANVGNWESCLWLLSRYVRLRHTHGYGTPALQPAAGRASSLQVV